MMILTLAVTAALALQADPPPKPHVVYLLADDLGWKDVGWHGSEIQTPNLDALAASGIRLEQFYVQPVCSPTRAALMTGRYPIRMGLQVHVIRPFAEYGVPQEDRFLPQALKEVGYRTAICGKWHLGMATKAMLPTSRGFDHQYGHYLGNLDYFTHRRDGGLDWHRNEEPLEEEGYTTDLIGNEAVRIIEGHDPSTPLFLYVPFNAPHSPLQAPESWIKGYAHIKDKKRRTYCAMVACMDAAVGRIREALDKKGMTPNTLVLFSSDNGGPTRSGADNGHLRAGKGTVYEGGVRVAACASWPGVLKRGSLTNDPMHIVDWHATILRLAGAKPAKDIDGMDFWPALTLKARGPRTEVLMNVTEQSGAVRRGDWKLVRNGKKTELFKVSDDPSEKAELSKEHPDKLKELTERLDAYAAAAVTPQYQAKPAPGWKSPKVWKPWR